MPRPALGVQLVLIFIVVACGGGTGDFSAEAPTAPSRSTTSTPPTLPSATPDATGVTRYEIPVLLALEGGRADCPSDWLVYEGATYSACYPPDYYAHTWTTGIHPLNFSVRLIPGEPVAYTPWGITSWSTDRYEPSMECFYQQETVAQEAETELMPIELSGSTGVACHAKIGDAVQFKGVVPTNSGGFAFQVDADGPEQLSLGMMILETVRLAQE